VNNGLYGKSSFRYCTCMVSALGCTYRLIGCYACFVCIHVGFALCGCLSAERERERGEDGVLEQGWKE